MKRLLDITLSLLGIMVLAPVFIIIAILINRDSEGGVFFRQERVGKNGKIFRIFKFRSMAVVQAEGSLKITVGADRRITKIGAFIRKYKIDELPQLFNVLIGEMSLVGPRPEVEEYTKLYSPLDKKLVLGLRPGITDIASLRFRNESEILAKEANPQEAYIKKIMPRKLRYCRFYARKKSLALDLKIIWMTVMAVVGG